MHLEVPDFFYQTSAISPKIGREKFHAKSTSRRDEPNFFHREILGVGVPNMSGFRQRGRRNGVASVFVPFSSVFFRFFRFSISSTKRNGETPFARPLLRNPEHSNLSFLFLFSGCPCCFSFFSKDVYWLFWCWLCLFQDIGGVRHVQNPC